MILIVTTISSTIIKNIEQYNHHRVWMRFPVQKWLPCIPHQFILISHMNNAHLSPSTQITTDRHHNLTIDFYTDLHMEWLHFRIQN